VKSIFPILLFASFLLADTQTVAISYFDNTSGLEEYNPLSKGLADMLITDLSNVKSIQIVEREKLESLLSEIKLGGSQFFDPSTAQQLGKGLGADIILTGAFLSIEPDMRIDARLIDVETGKIIKANKVLGKSSDFFMLESQLVDQLIADLDIKLTTKRPQVKKEIKLDAVVEYSKSIDLFDRGFNEESKRMLERTLDNHPDFYYAADKIKRIKNTLKLYEQNKSKLIQQEINTKINSLDINDDAYYSDLFNIFNSLTSSFEYTKMLIFVEHIQKLNLDPDIKIWETTDNTVGSQLLYYEYFANLSLKKYQKGIDLGELFLKLYPTSSWSQYAKTEIKRVIELLEKKNFGISNIDDLERLVEITSNFDILQSLSFTNSPYSIEFYNQYKNFIIDNILTISNEDIELISLCKPEFSQASNGNYENIYSDTGCGEISSNFDNLYDNVPLKAIYYKDFEFASIVLDFSEELMDKLDWYEYNENGIYEMEERYEEEKIYIDEQLKNRNTLVTSKLAAIMNIDNYIYYDEEILWEMLNAGYYDEVVELALKLLYLPWEWESFEKKDEHYSVLFELFNYFPNPFDSSLYIIELYNKVINAYEQDSNLKILDEKTYKRSLRKYKKNYNQYFESIKNNDEILKFHISSYRYLKNRIEMYNHFHLYDKSIMALKQNLVLFNVNPDFMLARVYGGDHYAKYEIYYHLYYAYSNLGSYDEARKIANLFKLEFPDEYQQILSYSIEYLPK